MSRVAVTLGDPAGVGPELVARVMADPPPGVDIVAVGNECDLAAGAANARIPFSELQGDLADINLPGPVPAGGPSPAGGRSALASIRRAVDLAVAGEIDGICTAPISKQSIEGAGCRHRGHTELLAEWAGGGHVPSMVFVAGRQRVALLTTHIPLAEVPQRVTKESILDGIERLNGALRCEFGETEAVIRVASLNPHLGEGGLLGKEEITAIGPAVDAAIGRGINVEGPESPELLFAPREGPVEGVLALYHDQALGPLKAIHGLDMVNVTCGLSIIRTSPDHGTAFDIAGTGRASDRSLRLAVEWARRIHHTRKSTDQ